MNNKKNGFDKNGVKKIFKGITIHNTDFVEATELVPNEWQDWFWGLISENAPFSWGDNNRTMITASSFADHCENCLDTLCEDEGISQEEIAEFLDKVRSLGETYVDLEN